MRSKEKVFSDNCSCHEKAVEEMSRGTGRKAKFPLVERLVENKRLESYTVLAKLGSELIKLTAAHCPFCGTKIKRPSIEGPKTEKSC